MFSFVPDMSSAKSAAADVMKLLDSKPEIDAESSEGDVPTNVQGRIRFENVHFRYPTRAGVRVLRDLNLSVEPGTYVALVGASGCGKSTTIQLIERFYDPLAGTVYVSTLEAAWERQVLISACDSSTSNRSRSTTSPSTASTSPSCHRSLHCTPALCASTSSLVPSSPGKR